MSFFPSYRGFIPSVVGAAALFGCGEVLLDPFDAATAGGGQGAEGAGTGEPTTSTSPTTSTGGNDGGGGGGPNPGDDQRPLLLLAQAGGVAMWGHADGIGSDVLPTATLKDVSNPRKLARRGNDAWVYTQGDTSVAKVLQFANVGFYAGEPASGEVAIDVPNETGATNIHDFRVDAAGKIFVEHIPLAQPFLPDLMMFMHWQGTDGDWARSDFTPYWRTYAFAVEETVIFGGSSEGIHRIMVNRETGSMHQLGVLGPQFGGYPLVAMYDGDLVAVSACNDAAPGGSCYVPRLRVWRDIGDGSTNPAPDVDIELDVALAPCALDVSETGTFIAMCTGLGGPTDGPPRLLRFATPSVLDSSSTPFGDISLPNEPRELAVLPADPAIDDDPFTVFVRCDDRLVIARDHMGELVLDEEMVNGISTTYDMLVVD